MSDTTANDAGRDPQAVPAASPAPIPAAEVTPGTTPDAAPEQLPDAVLTADAAPAAVAADAASETKKPQKKPATPEQRARRGANVAGAISLPLVTAGIVMLAVPLAVWYLNTIVRTIAVVVANAVSGTQAAEDTNSTLSSIEPSAMSTFTLALAIIGAVFVLAGALVSFFVMRTHGVSRPGMVTAIAFPVGLVIATILSASFGALGGLLFGTSDTVGQVLANAALAIAITTIGSVGVTVVTGALVWPVVARVFRAPAEQGAAARS